MTRGCQRTRPSSINLVGIRVRGSGPAFRSLKLEGNNIRPNSLRNAPTHPFRPGKKRSRIQDRLPARSNKRLVDLGGKDSKVRHVPVGILEVTDLYLDVFL